MSTCMLWGILTGGDCGLSISCLFSENLTVADWEGDVTKFSIKKRMDRRSVIARRRGWEDQDRDPGEYEMR